MSYTELHTTTNFTFLRGASHPEEMVEQAAAYGYKAIAITDRNTFAGIVRGHVAAKQSGMRIIPSCRLDLVDGPSLLAFPTDIDAYAQISNLLTVGNLRTEKGKCELYKTDVYQYSKGSKFIALPPTSLNEVFEFDGSFKESVRQYREALGEHLYIAASRTYGGDDAKQLYRIAQLAKQLNMPMVATNDVHYHHPLRRELQDVVTCVREKCTIHTAGFRLHPNAERYLKPIDEMLRLFRQYPDAIRQTLVISEACTFSLDQLKYRYPKEITSNGRTPQEELVFLTWQGAKNIFGEQVPDKIKASIEYELTFIGQVNYAEYFLTVYDIVRYAREQKILCQGRGSAANSTVCYCLGITSADPSKFDLLFERFISSARNEPPDIDVDFEHERREEVMQYIYKKYGRDRAAIVATVTQQHHKGAIRDVGKAMGLSVDTINRLSGLIWDFKDEGFDKKRIVSQGINPDDPTIRKVLELTSEFIGFPRQLGQHTGGFVITQGKLSDLCPILNARMEDRTNIEWNKDDIDALGFLKIDVLALGMLTCIRKAFDLAKKHYNVDLTLANIPQDDPKVYEMVSHADTIGVFQIESRAQQSMLPRLRPKCFYDLVIEVAIVRPGPIQGDMVHPYLRRRNGEEPIEYPSKELEEILGRTLGIPLFQEQAMKIAIVAAGFSPAEADELRRSMATFKAKGKVSYFQDKLIKGMTAKGYSLEYAQRVFRQLEGFGSYGFPESHAVSFALLVYVSSWIKCYYPDVFAGALLNSMPMGFYQPAQIIIDARKHGVEVLPVDVNYSQWDNKLEEMGSKYWKLRLGFRQVKGLREDDMDVLMKGRKNKYSIDGMAPSKWITFRHTQAPGRSYRTVDSKEKIYSQEDFYFKMWIPVVNNSKFAVAISPQYRTEQLEFEENGENAIHMLSHWNLRYVGADIRSIVGIDSLSWLIFNTNVNKSGNFGDYKFNRFPFNYTFSAAFLKRKSPNKEIGAGLIVNKSFSGITVLPIFLFHYRPLSSDSIMQTSKQFLDNQRLQGDDAADALIAATFSKGKQAMMFALLKLEEKDIISASNSGVKKFLLSQKAKPDWFDSKRLRNEQRLFLQYASEMMALLGAMSLPYCYAASPGNKALYLSDKMRNAPGKRLMDTAAFVIEVLTPGSFDDGQRPIAINKVRLIHALSRYYLSKQPQWEMKWGVPINQEDMAGTNLAFSYVILLGMQQSGFILSQKEKEDFVFTWRYIGYLTRFIKGQNYFFA